MGLVRNSRYYNYTLNNNGVIEYHGDDYEKDYLPDLITNNSIKFINKMERSKSPFMAVLGECRKMFFIKTKNQIVSHRLH